MKIYTKTGDTGETGLFGGPRVAKDDVRIQAYGDVDELNALIGVVRSSDCSEMIDTVLLAVQHDLFCVGAELATPDPESAGTNLLTDSRIAALESAIDEAEKSLAPLKQFILPAGPPAAAWLHLARTVCRRAERHVVTLARSPDHEVSPRLIRYLNRLSDALFVLARLAAFQANSDEVGWQKPTDDS